MCDFGLSARTVQYTHSILRRALGTALRDDMVQGVHPKVIQSVLGWDQMSMVDRHAHFVDEMRKDAAAKMDAILIPVVSAEGIEPSTY